MYLSISNVITVQDPTPEVEYYCKSKLTIPNPEHSKKLRMGFWTGNTPEKLHLYERKGNSLILPYGTIGELSEIVGDAPVTPAFALPAKVDYKCKVPLYDYQEPAVEYMLNARYGILQAPAGSGKTQMGIALIGRLGLRALWITHTKDLLKQSRDRAAKYMDSSLFGTITEGKVDIGSGLTFATVQTLARIDLAAHAYTWDVIVVDECHRVSGTPTTMTMFYKVLNALSARHKYGLSATPHRSDGLIRATYALLGGVQYVISPEVVADRVMKVGVMPCFTGVGIKDEWCNSDGTINYTALINGLCRCFDRNCYIISQIVRNAEAPCLILSDRLEHLEYLKDNLPAVMKHDAVLISGEMRTKKARLERDTAIADMRSGKKKYLFATYNLAKEGLDIPCLERLFLTTPHNDYAVITQAIGRIARRSEGKSEPVVYDFVDDSGYLMKSYKKRKTVYRKNNCYFLEEEK